MAEADKPVQWFYGRNGAQRGPFSSEEMGRMAGAGTLFKGDLVWRQGFGQWLEAGSVPEFAGSFRAGATVTGADSDAPPALERFRDPTGLTRILSGLLIATAVFFVVAAGSGALELNLLYDFKNDVYPDDAQRSAVAAATDARQAIIGLVQIVLLLATVIVFIKWIVRSNFNVRQLGATGLRFTPNWAAGWYFIPFANLWKPYQAMSEIWRASKSPASWSTDRPSGLVPLWWTFFLTDNILSNFAAQLTIMGKDIDSIIFGATAMLVSDLFSIPAALVALLLVRNISWMQTQAWRDRQEVPPRQASPASPIVS